MGHYSAATSLAQRVHTVNPEANLIIEDIFEYAMPDYSEAVYKGFHFMVRRGSRVYNQYYNKMELKGPDLKPVFLPYFIKKLISLLEKEQPDAILSTLPLCSQIVSCYKGETKDTIPLITCITDISSHSEWINSHTDCYLVPSKSIRQKLMEKGVDGGEIYVYGIPVRSEFETEKKMGQNPQKHILIMGGGLGILPDSHKFYEKLNRLDQCKITVITGKNQEVYDKLYGKYVNINVIGYTNEVYRYMLEADVVISKPGGITIFEAIRSETPLLVLEPFLQQEINNTGFILNQGIGMLLKKNQKTCLKEILRIVNNDKLLEDMKNQIRRLKQEYDLQVLNAVLAYIEYAGKVDGNS